MNLQTAAAQRQHYAAIRARLNKPTQFGFSRSKPIGATEIYLEPVGPRVPKEGCLRYAGPIGPVVPEPEKGRDILFLRSDVFLSKRIARQVIEETCAKHHITIDEIFAHRRETYIVRARQEAMYRLNRVDLQWSFPKIGEYFGGLDHTTALHGVRAHMRRMAAGEAL